MSFVTIRRRAGTPREAGRLERIRGRSRRERDLGGVAWREDHHPRAEKLIDDRVDFAVAAAFRKPDRLKIRPPVPPLAKR